jgi:hypothetical protein
MSRTLSGWPDVAIGIVGLIFAVARVGIFAQQSREFIGREIAVHHHLADGEEFMLALRDLLAYGERLFTAVWTTQEAGGRPLAKGTGASLSDVENPLAFPRNFNRISGPDANSCAGCLFVPRSPSPPTGNGVWATSRVKMLARTSDMFPIPLAWIDGRLGCRSRPSARWSQGATWANAARI